MVKITLNGKKYDYIATHTPMDLIKIKDKIYTDKTFQMVFRRNVTEDFMTTMVQVVNPNIRNAENTIWNVRGESGVGKSLVTISLAKQLTPDTFNFQNVVFYDQQILDKAKEIPRDSFLIRDEALKTFGIGSVRVSTDLTILSETCRKAGISLAFLSPSEREIPVAKYIFDVIDRDYTNRITRVALKDPTTQNYLGAVYVKVLPENDPDWIAYNKAKDDFIESVREGNRKEGKGDYKSLAKEMAKQIDCECFRTKRQRLAYLKTELSNLTSGEIDIISVFMEMVIENGEDSIDDKKQD